MRYIAIFKDGSQYSLFGSDYFNDKAVFWRSHQTNLVGFSVNVCSRGRPVEIIDGVEKIFFKTDSEFDHWYLRNQSKHIDFGFSHLSENKEILEDAINRIGEIIKFIETELEELKAYPFDPWKYDGGYKELNKMCLLGITSLTKILSGNDLDSSLYLIKQCFETPDNMIIDQHSIFSYKKLAHEKINPNRLIEFCEINIDTITKKLNEIKPNTFF